MNKYLTIGMFAMLSGVLGAGLLMPYQAHASPASHAKAWGYYGMTPGHMKHTYRYEYRVHNEQFDELEAFREYIREYLREWRELHGLGWYYADDDMLRVTTGTATSIDTDSATLRATVDPGDSDDAEVWFEYGPATSDLDDDTAKAVVSTDGSITRTVSGLDEDTRYYYRVVAEDEDGTLYRGVVRSFMTDEDDEDDAMDEPELTTLVAEDIQDDRVDLRGKVDMNDYDNGVVFFVYGTDRSSLEDVEGDYDTYAAIDEDGEKLQKFEVDSDLDGVETYTEEVVGLDDDTLYYYAIGVAYEDEDADDVLEVGAIRSFRTDE